MTNPQPENKRKTREVERMKEKARKAKPMPKRIQRKRTKGWKMPPNTVYVGRPTKWGNPYELKDCPSREQCVKRFRSWCGPEEGIFCRDVRSELRGKDLACWCPLDQPCHADVLLEIANGSS